MSEITWKYVKPLKDENAIESFEKKNNVSFPSDLKSYLKEFNGGRPSLKYYDLQGEKDKEFKTLLSFNESDVENIYKAYPLDSSLKILPFASDPAGNYFVVDSGKISLWNHESDSVKEIADSFTNFLNLLHD